MVTGWTDSNGRGFATVTASFIDVQTAGLPRRSMLLDLVPFDSSHDARSYARVLGGVISDFSLGTVSADGITDSKVVYVVSDSASNMVACFQRLDLP